MLNILSVASVIMVVKEIIKEILEPVAPPEQHFDWSTYYKDIENGISCMEQVRKRQRGGYNTCESVSSKKTLYDFQYEKYLKDKADYPEYAEAKNQMGAYGWRF